MIKNRLTEMGHEIDQLDNYSKLLVFSQFSTIIEVYECETDMYANASIDDNNVYIFFEDYSRKHERELTITPEDFNKNYEIRNLALV